MAGTLQFDAVVSSAQLNKLLDDLRTGAEGAALAINSALGGTVTKKLVLQEVADGTGGKKLVAVEKERLSITDQLTSKQKKLNATQDGSVTSLRQQVNNLRQARDAVARYETSVNAVGTSIRRQRAEWSQLNAEVSQVSRNLAVAGASTFWERIKVATRSQGLINISNGLVGLTQGFQAASILAGQFLGAINSIVDASAKLQSFALAFKAIGAGSAGAVAGLQESSRIALGLGVDLNTVIEGFRQLSPVVLNSGGTLGDVSSIVESLSSRFAAFGISGDKARRVMNGIIQAFSKGKLQAEELTQQISEADPAFKTDLAAALLASKNSLGALGKEIDGTIPNLEKLVKAGQLTSEVLIKVLPQLSKSELLYGKLGSSAGSSVDALERSAVTIDQVRANLKNLGELSLRELALSSGPLINALLRLQAVTVDAFTRISKSTGIDVISSVAAKAVEVIAKLADGFFVLAEGAINIVGALKPVIDLVLAISQIPGVAQLAGLALLGKFLGPLKLLEGRIASTKTAFQGFKNGIKDIFQGSGVEINRLTDDIQRMNKELGRSDRDASLQGPASRIGTGTRKALSEITALGAASASEIQNQITRLEANVERTRARLAAPRSGGGEDGSVTQTRGQRALQGEIQRTSNLLASQRRLLESNVERGDDPSSGSMMRLQAEITTTEQRLQGLQQRLATSVGGEGSGLTGTEIRRQERLRARLDINLERLQELRTRLAEQGPSTTQDRRAVVNFDPSSTEAARKATEDYTRSLRENAKERLKGSDFAKGGLDRIADQEKKALDRLKEIDKERADIQKRAEQAKGFRVAGFDQSDFGADQLRRIGDEADELRGKLSDLKDERGQLQKAIEGAAASESNVSKILDDGAKKTATATERQRAFIAQREILKRQSQAIEAQLAKEAKALEKTTAARANLEDRRLSGKLDDPTGEALLGYDTRIEESRAEISRLVTEQERLRNAISGVDSSLKTNAANFANSNGAIGRITTSFARLKTQLRDFGKGVFDNLRSGVSGLLGLLDPLLVVMIAVGVGSRLYADGTKQATEATQRYAEQSKVLQAAINDISPGFGVAKEETTALGRAWDSLAASTVKIGDALSFLSEELAKFAGSQISAIEGLVSGLDDGLVNLAGSIALVSGTTALGAALGAAGGPAGIAALGTIGAIVGIVSALGLGSSQAAIDLAKLEKELQAVEAGSSASVKQVSTLVTALESIPRDETGNFSGPDATKISEGYEATRKAAAEARKEVERLSAIQSRAREKDELASRETQRLLIEEKKLREEGAQELPGGVLIFPAGSTKAQQEELKRLDGGLTNNLKRQKELTEQRAKQFIADEKLGSQIGALNTRVVELTASEQRALEVRKQLAAANIEYFDTTSELGTAIKDLQEANTNLELGDPKSRETLGANLEQVKELQAGLELLGKTPVEIKIEIRKKDDQIANAVNGITLDPGPFRETRELIRGTATEIQEASLNFQKTAQVWADRAKEGSDKIGLGAKLTKESARELLLKTTQSAAKLMDAGRQLGKDLFTAINSLDGLTLSNTKFFTQQEINDAAESINTRFNALTLELGITPVIEGDTEIERLKEKLSFIETREQAKELRESIDDIGTSLNEIVIALTAIPGVLEVFKKNGIDIANISKDAADAIGDIGGSGAQKLARVGEVLGEITANGETTVIFFDNLTGQTEQLSKAEFDAAVAADKLAASVKGAGSDAKDAEGKLGGLKAQIGQVFGTITANGKTQVQFFNKATGQVETLEQAAFDRLKKEEGVTKEIGKQNTALDASLKLVKDVANSPKAAPPIQDVGGFKVGGGATGRGTDTGGVGFNPGGNQSEEQGNAKMREIAQRNGGEYNRVLADVIANGGAGFMPTAQLASLQADTDRYDTALLTLKGAQDQAAQAQTAYNQALASGSPDLLTIAGNLANAKQALSAANMEVEGSAPGYQAAIDKANELGISLNSINPPNQLADTGPTKTAQERWNDYVDSVRQGGQQIDQSSKEVNQSLQGIQGVGDKLLDPAEVDASKQVLSTYSQDASQILQGIKGVDNKLLGPADITASQQALSTYGQVFANAVNGINSNKVGNLFADAAIQGPASLDLLEQEATSTVADINNQKPGNLLADTAIQGGFSLDVLGQKATSVISGINAISVDNPVADAAIQGGLSLDVLGQKANDTFNSINGLGFENPFTEITESPALDTLYENVSDTYDSIGELNLKDPLADIAESPALDTLYENVSDTFDLINGFNFDDIAEGSSDVEDSLKDATAPAGEIKTSLVDGVNPAGNIAQSLGTAAENAATIGTNIDKLENKTVRIRVEGVPILAAATGGPVNAGQQVQVNEQGKEGFLSRSGSLSQINVPAYAIWRPPSSGTIIPAPIWDKIKDPPDKDLQTKSLNVYNQEAAYVVNNIGTQAVDEPPVEPIQGQSLDAYAKKAVDTIGAVKSLKIGDPFSDNSQGKPLDAYAQKAVDIIDGVGGLRAGDPFAKVAQGQPLDAYAKKADATASGINDLKVGDPFSKIAQSPALEAYTEKAAGSIDAINNLDISDPFAKASEGRSWDAYNQKAINVISGIENLQIQDPLALASEGKPLDVYAKKAVDSIKGVNNLAVDDPFAEVAQGQSFNAYAQKATDYIEAVDNLAVGDPFTTASQGQSLDSYAKKASDTISGINNLAAGDPFSGVAQGQPLEAYRQKVIDTINGINSLAVGDPFAKGSQAPSLEPYSQKAIDAVSSISNLQISDPFDEASQGQSFDAYKKKATSTIGDVDSLQISDPFDEASQGQSFDAYAQKATSSIEGIEKLVVNDPLAEVAQGQSFDAYAQKAVSAINSINDLAVDDLLGGSLAGVNVIDAAATGSGTVSSNLRTAAESAKAIADNVQSLQGLTVDVGIAAAGGNAPVKTQEEVTVTREIRDQGVAIGRPLEPTTPVNALRPSNVPADQPSSLAAPQVVSAASIKSEVEGPQGLRDAAQRNGEEYSRALAAAVVSEINTPSFSVAPEIAPADTSAYEASLGVLQDQALVVDAPGLAGLVASLGLASRALAVAGAEALGIAPSYRQAASAARELSMAITSVPSIEEKIDDTPLLAARESWKQYANYMLKSSQIINGAAQEEIKKPVGKGAIDSADLWRDNSKQVKDGAGTWLDYASLASRSIQDINRLSLDSPLEDATSPAGSISKSLETAADNAAKIKSSLDKLKDMTVKISVSGVPGFFTGGPVSAGQEIRVNELGKEGFLSRSGSLSPINVPANATWRPPTSGTIIPAHIWDKIDAPSGRVKTSQAGPALRAGMSNSQTRQAQELGILGRAVYSLAGQVRALTAKDWTVKTNIRNSAGNTQIRMMNGLL